MKLLPSVTSLSAWRARRDTLNVLKRLSDKQLIDSGISPELLKEGVKAWPWRESADDLTPISYRLLENTRVNSEADKTDSSVNAA
ncbi:MAG: DUF1127 domain-containing protein [Granulosicoccus sp.]|nr:DUF1127 domain-containing protein [Granulosicoccus sp.]